MTGEDSHLEASYEDANGNPHGIGSPEWDEEGYDSSEFSTPEYYLPLEEEDEDEDLEPYEGEHGYPEGEEPNPYHGTYSEM